MNVLLELEQIYGLTRLKVFGAAEFIPPFVVWVFLIFSVYDASTFG